MTDEYAVKYLDDLAEKNHNLDVSWDMREAVRMGRDAIRDRIARQNPQPLTLKELRKYKHGDPIYLVDTEKPENTGWELWIADLPDGCLDTIAYGKTWLAYRRKPETKGV